MTTLVKPKLFNEFGSDSFKDQVIINGNPSGIANLNSIRYGWVNPIYREMIGNTWFPEKVDMTNDRTTIKNLTSHEDEAVDGTLGFLIFLDNYQVANLPNVAEYVTNPAVRNLLSIQAYQEVIHSAAYQYILESLRPSMTRDKIYNMWKDDKILLERNKTLASIGEEFTENPSEDGFLKICLANLVLEGIFFYQGFNFFDQLRHRNRLVQTAMQIDYIRKDEFTHVGIFTNIIRELNNPKLIQFAHEIVDAGVRNEIKWCHHRYGNRILGISEKSSEDYVKWLGNDRLARIGVPPLWENVENPYQYIETSQMAGGSRKNFFESAAVTEYDTAESVSGWDKL
jgi:ribonucleoside-diphosphate reductase beta chain